MVNKLLDFFKKNNLDYQNKKFILAVSTGVDSAVLLDAFLKLKNICDISIIVCHVNHHMRKQSEEEEKYIEKYCKLNNISFYKKDLYFESNSNFEMIAREARYSFLYKIYDKENADYLVLAHHGNDNVETIIMRMLRGSSLAGYSGINDVSIYDNKTIIRPFIELAKNDIIQYQKENNIIYFEDESNKSYSHTRNRVRHEIVPKLEEECNDLINKINEFRKTIYEASKVIDSVRDNFINEFVNYSCEEIIINRSEYLKLSEYLKEEVLFEILKPYKLSKVNIRLLIDIISSNKQNYQNWFKEEFKLVLEYDKVIIGKNCKQIINDVLVINGPGEYYFDNKKIVCVLEKDNKNDYNNKDLWYNSESMPIVIRHRQNGDKIKCSGITKKIKDLFIDLKMPMSQRDSAILACKDDEVLIIFGVRKSDLLKNSKNNNLRISIMEEYNG